MIDRTGGGQKRRRDNGDTGPAADISSSTTLSPRDTKETVGASHFELGARPQWEAQAILSRPCPSRGDTAAPP